MDIARALRIENFVWVDDDNKKHTVGRDRLAGMVINAVRNFCQSDAATPGREHLDYVDGIDVPEASGRRTYQNNNLLGEHLLPAVRAAWADFTSPTGTLSWNRGHHIYLKMWERSNPAILAEFLLVDEAQDVSGVMLSIIRQQPCQKVLVGDSNQAIFGFLNLVDALAIFREAGCRVGRLSKSFRFGDAVADVANGLLGRLGADLRLTGFERILSVVGPHPEPTAILTRTNAAAVRLCLVAIAEGRRPLLVGGAKDVVVFAEGARDLQNGRPTSHPDLSCFETWAQVEEYCDQDEQGEDLRLLVKLVTEFGPQTIIDGLSQTTVREADADVIVSTAHKSKGCGWSVVQIAGDFKPPKDGGEMSAAELKLAYVAVTRAKVHLDLSAVPHFAGLPGLASALPVEATGVAEMGDDGEESAFDLTTRYGGRS